MQEEEAARLRRGNKMPGNFPVSSLSLLSWTSYLLKPAIGLLWLGIASWSVERREKRQRRHKCRVLMQLLNNEIYIEV